jgi:hypothetical protein
MHLLKQSDSTAQQLTHNSQPAFRFKFEVPGGELTGSQAIVKLRNHSATKTVISICIDLFCSHYERKSSGCFSLPVHCWPPGVRMVTPMLPMISHIIITDIEEEEGNKASPVHRRRRPAFNQSANQTRIPINSAAMAIRLA